MKDKNNHEYIFDKYKEYEFTCRLGGITLEDDPSNFGELQNIRKVGENLYVGEYSFRVTAKSEDEARARAESVFEDKLNNRGIYSGAILAPSRVDFSSGEAFENRWVYPFSELAIPVQWHRGNDVLVDFVNVPVNAFLPRNKKVTEKSIENSILDYIKHRPDATDSFIWNIPLNEKTILSEMKDDHNKMIDKKKAMER